MHVARMGTSLSVVRTLGSFLSIYLLYILNTTSLAVELHSKFFSLVFLLDDPVVKYTDF